MASVAPAPESSAPGIAIAPAEAARRKLRVGVFADGAMQPRWLVEALARIAACDFAELAYVCVENGARHDFPQGGKSCLAPFSWRAYSALDRKVFGAGEWSQPREIAALVPASRRVEEGALATQEPIDVAVALGDVRDDMLEGIAAYGVWRYCFGADQAIDEPLAGVREVIDAADVTGSGIRVRLGAGRPDRIVYESWSRTLPLSVARSRDNVFAKSTQFLARALRDLHEGGAAWLERARPAGASPSQQAFPASIAGRMAMRVARRATEKLATVEQWSLAYRFVDIEPWTGSLEGFHHLVPPRDRFWADPFPIQRNGKSHVFFEELPFAAGRAHISVVEVGRDGRASQPLRVLERDYHLSYPFLIEDAGQLYMIPESAANETIEIYRCVDFPGKWRRERVLVDGIYAADATVHRANGRWWMFANVAARGAEIHDELHVFTSDALLGDWTPLAGNPVKSDVRGARPAGRLFTQGGKLYRPAQICAPLYGSGIALQRVTHLEATRFAEEEERRIVPAAGSGLLGLHTINRAGDLSVIDAFTRRPRLRARS